MFELCWCWMGFTGLGVCWIFELDECWAACANDFMQNEGLLHMSAGMSSRYPCHLVDVRAVENEAYQAAMSCSTMSSGNRLDLLEGWAGAARCSGVVVKRGLTATQPADLKHNCNLAKTGGVTVWKSCVEVCQPHCVLVGLNCMEWYRYTVAGNYVGREQELAERQEKAMGIIRLAIWTAERQARDGRWLVMRSLYPRGSSPSRSSKAYGASWASTLASHMAPATA